jgi:hypothetical protein
VHLLYVLATLLLPPLHDGCAQLSAVCQHASYTLLLLSVSCLCSCTARLCGR